MPKRVIIVDDDKDLRQLLQMHLEAEGFEVQVAANGLRLLSSLHVDRPDIILLDVVMSWINGFELCQALKKNPEYADIPVFFISGKTSVQDVSKGFESGCTDYFTKPIDLKFLVKRIRQVIGDP